MDWSEWFLSTKEYVVGTQKNRLSETVLLSTKIYARTYELMGKKKADC